MGEALNLAILLTVKDAASKPLSGIMSSLGGVGKAALAIGGAAVVGIGVFADSLWDDAQAAAEEEVGIARLIAAVEASGASWEEASAKIEDYLAKETARTALDDGEGREALARLTATTGDYNEALNLLGLAQDIARGKNIDLQTAAELVGRVHEGNIGILSRYGITLEEGATAQDALAALQERFSGQAEAYGNTFAGAQEKMSIALGNLKETIGAAVLPVLTQLFTKLSDLVTAALPAVEDALNAVGPVFEAVFGWIEANVVPVLSTIVGYVVENWPAVQAVIVEVWNGVVEFLNATLVPLADAIFSVFGAIATFLSEHSEQIKAVIQFAWDFIRNLIDSVLTIIRGIIQTVVALIHGDWEGAWEGIKTVFSGIWKAIETIVSTELEIIKSVLSTAWSVIKSVATGAWNGIKSAISGVWDNLRGAVNSHLTSLKTSISNAWGAVRTTATSAWNGIRDAVADKALDMRKRLADRWQEMLDHVSGPKSYLGRIKTAITSTFVDIKMGVLQAWDGLKTGVRNTLNGLIGFVNVLIRGWNAIEFRIPGFHIDFPSITVAGVTVGGGSLGWAGLTIGTPDIPLLPALAEGGIVTRPTLALVGEAGPEAIVPLRRRGAQDSDLHEIIRVLVVAVNDLVRALGAQSRADEALALLELQARRLA